MVNESIAIAPGSGCHAQYLGTLLFSLDAKVSMSGFPNLLHMSLKSVWLISHSVVSLKTLDASSASTFKTPGQCAADSQMFNGIAQAQIWLATELHDDEWVEPCLLMPTTVEVLSLFMRIWQFDWFAPHVCSAKRAALSSRKFMSLPWSSRPQRPPVFRFVTGT